MFARSLLDAGRNHSSKAALSNRARPKTGALRQIARQGSMYGVFWVLGKPSRNARRPGDHAWQD
jgi:hypothetical protein